MAGRNKTETVEAEVVETAVVPAGKMEFRLINPTEDGFLRRIQWNKEELEAAVRAKIAGYENVVYTEENIKAAKNDRAELNKLIKAIEERRKQVKNIINEPYAVFEAELWWHRYLRRNKSRRVYRNGRSGTVYRPGADYAYSRSCSLDMVEYIGGRR